MELGASVPYLSPLARRLPRGELQHERPEPEGDFVEIQLGSQPDQVVKVGKNLPINIMKNMIKVLQDNKDIFA